MNFAGSYQGKFLTGCHEGTLEGVYRNSIMFKSSMLFQGGAGETAIGRPSTALRHLAFWQFRSA